MEVHELVWVEEMKICDYVWQPIEELWWFVHVGGLSTFVAYNKI
jgi:hypothetical protein